MQREKAKIGVIGYAERCFVAKIFFLKKLKVLNAVAPPRAHLLKAFCNSSELPVEDLGGGVSRQILVHDNEIMMVKVIFEKGAIGYIHHHPHRQVSYVASGEFEVSIDDEKKVLIKGDAFYAAPHLNHGVLCTQSGTLIDIFNPTRLDFLE